MNQPRRRAARSLLLAFTLVALGGCTLPRDPNDTTERVRGAVMTVGVSEAPPWVVDAPEGPAGIEPDLVRAFAAELHADVEWVWADSTTNLEALAENRLDLVVGGLTAANPWSRRVGFTNPYYTERITVGVAPGTQPPPEIEGEHVHVAAGSAIAGIVARSGGTPVPVADPFAAGPPVAAPAWALQARGLTPADFTLERRSYVMAIQAGENGFLVRLERFLAGQQDTITAALQAVTP